MTELQMRYRALWRSNRRAIIGSASLKYPDARARFAPRVGTNTLSVSCYFFKKNDSFPHVARAIDEIRAVRHSKYMAPAVNRQPRHRQEPRRAPCRYESAQNRSRQLLGAFLEKH
eukprot:5260807-Pyramimonas_sp.AAC.1